MKNETNPVDDFFRKSLQDHKVTPSEAARSRFMDEAAPVGGKAPGKLLRWYNILAVAVVITVSVFLISIFMHDNALAPGKMEPIPSIGNKNNPAPDINPNELNKPVANSNPGATAPTNSVNTEEKAEQVKSSGKSLQLADIRPGIKNEYFTNQKPKKINMASPGTTQNEPENSPSKTRDTEPEDLQPGHLTLISDTSQVYIPETHDITQPESGENNISRLPDAGKTPALTEKAPSQFIFTTFLAYVLDWNPKSLGSGLISSLNIEEKIQYHRFSLTSGIGIATTSGNNDYNVEYNDYLGNYKKLDSITFAWDTRHYSLEPTYHMTDMMVWDSTVKLDSYQVEKRYNYLRVPVLLGYDIYSHGRFSVGLKAGVEMYFYLASSNVTNVDYDAGQNKVVNISQADDGLTSTYFWLMTNFSASMNLGKRFVLEVEPHLKYQLDPAQTGSNQPSHDVLPGIRSSLKIKF